MDEDHFPSSLQAVLSAVADSDCRTILGTADDRMTASEIASVTDIPRSTVYRKLDRLKNAGLVEATCRFESGGKHPTEYARSFERIAVTVGDQAFALTVGDELDGPAAPVIQSPYPTGDADRAASLAEIFVTTTGTTTLVDPQDQERLRTAQAGTEEDSQALEEYVAASIAADGLAEAIDGADFGYSGD